ncbi:hypothetical protein Tco_1240648 [Tanacetum coccineum]
MCEALREQVPQWTISTTSDLIKEALPRLVLQEFAAHAPKIIEELFRIQMHNTVLNNALKAKYEKSLASPDSCRYDAFRKRDHDNHQGDDVPFKGEKSAKRQKTSIMIDEDEVIPEDETHDLLNEFQNVDKRVPAIYDRERIEATIREMLSNQFRDAEEYAYHLKQEKKFMENQVVWESRQEDLKHPQPEALEFYGEEVRRVFKTFNEEARLSIQHWKDSWHKRMYKIKHTKVKDDPEEVSLITGLLKLLELQLNNNMGLILYKPCVSLIYLNNKEEKRVRDLVDILKFCDATLEKVLKEVKLKIFETEFKTKTPLLGELDLKMKAYEREIMNHLKHHKHMRRWESFVNRRQILQSMKQQE